jgi:(p)ppGpp synthase/HD superfamily hydrolase
MKLKLEDKVLWTIAQHERVNQFYDKIHPYVFHLKSVVKVYYEYEDLLPQEKWDNVFLACYGHDLIEDTGVTYNDVKEVMGEEVAEIIYALTNEKGRTRAERANDKYYQGIRETPYAVFVKLCDRIANVEYSKKKQSRMLEVYRNENDNFMKKLGYDWHTEHEYQIMFDRLINILT